MKLRLLVCLTALPFASWAQEPPAALTPERRNFTDQTAALDRAFFAALEHRIRALPIDAPARAAAETWLLAARTEYEATNRASFVGEATARAEAIANAPERVTAATADAARIEVYDHWITYRRNSAGFRAALPLLLAAERLGRLPAAHAKTEFRPPDLPDSLFAVQERLAALHDRGMLVGSYPWAKAQAWLDFAIDEHRIRDRSGVVAFAAKQATTLIEHLTPDAASRTPQFRGTARIRDDLWTLAASVDPASSHGESRARLEVMLAQAAHEQAQRGTGTAQPYVQAAERLAAEIQTAPSP